MTDRVKQNFRYDRRRWAAAQRKADRMRRDGFDIDMTEILGTAVDQFVDETDDQTATRLRLTPTGGPVSLRRRPRGEF